jgi:hypothetical protein
MWKTVAEEKLNNLRKEHDTWQVGEARAFHNKLEEEKRDIARLMKELTKIRLVRPDDTRECQVFVRFDSEMISRCLIHGDDKELIHYIADSVAQQVAYELRTMNFVRYKDHPRWPLREPSYPQIDEHGGLVDDPEEVT